MKTAAKWLAVSIALLLLSASSRAQVADAIKSGDFAACQAELAKVLNSKVPAGAAETVLTKLIQDPAVATMLAQHRFIQKLGAANLGTFAKAGEENRTFLTWLLNNRVAMETYLEAATPTGLKAREEDKWTPRVDTLELWKKLFTADPDSKEGMYLRLAIGVVINPPPAMSSYSNKPIDPVARYKYFKNADKNNDLVPTFKNLTAWEYSKLMSQGGPVASDEEFTWGREMIRTFRPDFLEKQQVVNIVSMVWRRGSPVPYTGMQTMLQGGGKCGPRSTFGVFINQAFGIPAIGVGQPKHACVAYKAFDAAMEPQPGSIWKVGYGGGWNVSKLDGLSGPDFVEGVEARMRTAQFSQVEHLRWLAASLSSKELAASVMGVAQKIAQVKPATKIDMNGSLKAEEAEADPGAVEKSRFGKSTPVKNDAKTATAVLPVKPEAPVKVAPGVIHVEAASFVKTGGKISWGGQEPKVLVHNSYAGGKQVYFQQQMMEQWADYTVDVPAAGAYEITMKAACINEDQLLQFCSGTNVIASVPIDLSYGLWKETKPVEIKLEKGSQTIRVQTPTTEHKRGIALKWFEFKSKGAK